MELLFCEKRKFHLFLSLFLSLSSAFGWGPAIVSKGGGGSLAISYPCSNPSSSSLYDLSHPAFLANLFIDYYGIHGILYFRSPSTISVLAHVVIVIHPKKK